MSTNSSDALDAYVRGIGFWSSFLPGWSVAQQVMRGEAVPASNPASRPQPSLLPPAERRRAPDTLAVALEVALQACESAGIAPGEPMSVFASTHGDLAISDYMCETLASTPTLISPIRFHNSVHNAAAGYWSIATSSSATYTAISAYVHTFGVGLLEAIAQLKAEQKPVLFVAYDIAAKGPLGGVAPSAGLLGGALLLSPRAEGAKCKLSCTVRHGVKPEVTSSRTPAGAVTASNAMGPSVPLFEAIATHDSQDVIVSLSDDSELRVRVHPT